MRVQWLCNLYIEPKISRRNSCNYTQMQEFWTQKPETCVYIDLSLEVVACMCDAAGASFRRTFLSSDFSFLLSLCTELNNSRYRVIHIFMWTGDNCLDPTRDQKSPNKSDCQRKKHLVCSKNVMIFQMMLLCFWLSNHKENAINSPNSLKCTSYTMYKLLAWKRSR